MDSNTVTVIVLVAGFFAWMWWQSSRIPASPPASDGQPAPDFRSDWVQFNAESYDLELLQQIPAEYASRADLQQLVLVNDATTPMDLVIFVLEHVFMLTYAVAFDAMMAAHTEDECAIAVLPAELAAERIAAAREVAEKAGGYPLQIIARPLPDGPDQPA